MVGQDLHRGMGRVSDGPDPQGPQAGRRSSAAPVQIPDGQGPELRRDLLRKQGVGPVRLFEVAGHLGQKSVARDPDIYGKAQGLPDPLADLRRQGLCGLSPAPGPSAAGIAAGCRGPFHHRVHKVCRVHVGLIDGGLFDTGRIASENVHKLMRVLPVGRKIRRDDHQARTPAHGRGDRIRRTDPVLLGRHRLCRHDPVPRRRISAHDGRDRAQVHALRVLPEALDGRPGQEGRVDIYMKNDLLPVSVCHGLCLLRPIFAAA